MIRASGLWKYFHGKRALGPVSFDIERGETVGFLGLNGAGKTTALRILAGDLRPSEGALLINGVDAARHPVAVRGLVGFLPEQPPLYLDMSVVDYLRFAARLRGMDAGQATRRVAEVSDMLGLDVVGGELTRNLSEGYRQRVGIAQAIVHEPELLVLDEPGHDLDPAQLVQMRALLADLKNRHTVLLSSHNLPEISQTCDRLLVLNGGEIIASGTEAELAARWLNVQRIEVEFRLGMPEGHVDSRPGARSQTLENVIVALREIDGVRNVSIPRTTGEEVLVVIESDQDRRPDVCRVVVAGGHDLLRVDRSHQGLENVFLDLVRGVEGGRHSSHPEA